MNILIIGSGFLGGGLAMHFEKMHDINIYVKTREGELPSVEIDLIVDSTSQKSKKECEDFAVELAIFLKLYPNASVVSLQSFSTLQTQPKSCVLPNFGSKAVMHTPYSRVKEFKEQCLLRDDFLRGKMQFIYLPVVLGENGIWDQHSKALKATGKVVNIPDCKVDWVTISFICTEIISLVNTRWNVKRVIASEGVGYLDDLMGLSDSNRIKYWRSYFIDAFSFKLLKLFSGHPFLINAAFKVVEILFGRVSLYFPSIFYWLLFRLQSNFHKV